MNSFAVTMLVTAACIGGYFIPTVESLENCYECKEADVGKCGKSVPTTLTPVACALKCYEVGIRAKDGARSLGTIRGCASAADEVKCSGAPLGTHEIVPDTCSYCLDKDNCNDKPFQAPSGGTGTGNGHPTSFASSLTLCAFISSLAIAKMFHDTAM
eukprot:XP_003247067.1 PREDICTED: uncharacterized protein LOC100569428 [Acyrthosiphon pisum]